MTVIMTVVISNWLPLHAHMVIVSPIPLSKVGIIMVVCADYQRNVSEALSTVSGM